MATSTVSFEKLYKRAVLPSMSAAERRAAAILIVDSAAPVRQAVRQALIDIGFSSVFETADHVHALERIEQQPITHVIFDARKTNMPAKEFLLKTMEYSREIITIPLSSEPTIDNVFDLLVVGARGYIVKPFTQESLDEAVIMATKGEPISQSILYARNRNEALASLIMASLDQLATVLRQAPKFETARAEIPKRSLALKRAIDVGRTFALGGSEMLVEAIIQFTTEHCEGPATRLGRVRKRLEEKKGKGLGGKA